MRKNTIMFGVLIAVIITLFIGASVAFPFFEKQSSKIVITSNDTLNKGDNITVNLTDNSGKVISNATINITIVGGEDNQTASVVTNKSGIATLKIDKGAGSYVVNCTFAGDDDNGGNTTSQKLTIKEKMEDNHMSDSSNSDDSGAFYSAQEGRIIYTGEIHDAPDGHQYKHLGNNEWEKID